MCLRDIHPKTMPGRFPVAAGSYCQTRNNAKTTKLKLRRSIVGKQWARALSVRCSVAWSSSTKCPILEMKELLFSR